MPDTTIPFFTPFDLPQNQEIMAAIAEGSRKRDEANPPVPIDRREPAILRQTLENSKVFLGDLQQAFEKAELSVATATADLKAMNKLKKIYLKNGETTCPLNTKRDLESVERKISSAEHALSVANNNLKNAKRRVETQREGIENFLKERPRPEWRTNKEVIRDYNEQRDLEHSLRGW
jgi:hypothetical protein